MLLKCIEDFVSISNVVYVFLGQIQMVFDSCMVVAPIAYFKSRPGSGEGASAVCSWLSALLDYRFTVYTITETIPVEP